MNELLAIRVAISADIKKLPPERQTVYFNAAASQLEQEYNIRLRRPTPSSAQNAV
jgi:hypothetical protein